MKNQQKIYEAIYSTQQDVWTHQIEMRMFPEMILNNFPNRKMDILDIGCGHGVDLVYYAERGCQVTGIDFVYYPESRLAQYNNIAMIHQSFLCAHIRKQFDLVVDNGCFHHYEPINVDQYLIRLDAVIKQDGFYAVNTFYSGESDYRYNHHNRFFRYYLPDEIEAIFNSIQLILIKIYKVKIINSHLYYLAYLFRKNIYEITLNQ